VIGVVIGSAFASLVSDSNLLSVVFKGLCNAGEAVLIAWLLDGWFPRPFAFRDLRRVLGFLAAACLAAAAFALVGAATMTLSHGVGPFWDAWQTWFLSDALGIVVVAPFVIALGELKAEVPSRSAIVEGAGVSALLALVAMYVRSYPSASWVSFNPGAFTMPPLLWLAARSVPIFPITGALVVSISAICATIFGVGRLGDAGVPIAERVHGVQTTVVMVTVYTLVLTALFTDKRRREAEFKCTAERLQLALDGAELGVFRADLATGRLECDARTAQLHGLDVSPNTVTESLRFVHLDDLPRVDAALREAKPSARSWNAEYRVVHPSDQRHAGKMQWVAMEGAIVRDAQGVAVGLLGVTHDITSRKLAEQELAERNAQLELAGRTARVGSFVIDYVAGKVRLSPGCATLYGLPEGTMEMSREDARLNVHPEDLARIEALRNHALLSQQREWTAQCRIIRADNGEIRWVESRSLIAYNKDGRPLRMVGISIDLTEHKQAEENKSLLISELDHRVKNTLACVSVIVEQTRAASNSMDEFLAVLKGRIRSLANTHALLSFNRWQGVSLAELVRGELSPCMSEGNTVIEGPAINLSADAVQAIAIVLHELATNAAKYGALANDNGKVSVHWNWRYHGSSRTGVMLEWRETGGPAVGTPGAAGYGTGVIRDLIPYELGGSVEYALTGEGVRCRVEIPAKWVSSLPHQGDVLNGAEQLLQVP
jgi:PAS domain S-box-containing protein